MGMAIINKGRIKKYKKKKKNKTKNITMNSETTKTKKRIIFTKKKKKNAIKTSIRLRRLNCHIRPIKVICYHQNGNSRKRHTGKLK